MSNGVEFDEDKYGQARYSGSPKAYQSGSKMGDWLIKKGIAKSPAAANGILVGIIIVDFIIIYVVYKFFT